MTVKELIDILEACNPDAVVRILTWQDEIKIKDEQVFSYEDDVVFDITYTLRVLSEVIGG